MKHRPLLVAIAATVMFVAAPGVGAVASPTVRLAIAHVASHCHVWKTSTKMLGASTKITVKPGTKLVIRSDCPMDFDFAQTKGPRLPLGNVRTYAGSTRVITFRKVGTYRLTATNVQTPEERNLVVLGEPNTLTLTVVVKSA
jgi:hypothetical protein